MYKQVLFGFVILCLSAVSCSSGNYCEYNCDFMQRCNPAGPTMDMNQCVESCEQQLAGVSEDCRDALDDLAGCADDDSCYGAGSDCVGEAQDVFEECEGELFPAQDSCYGSARPCESIYNDQVQCEAQGCTYAAGCGDYAYPCSSMYSQTECEQQLGCTWSADSCSGDAAECETLDATQCETQEGCRIEDTCTGTTLPCELFLDEASCETIDGCHWI